MVLLESTALRMGNRVKALKMAKAVIEENLEVTRVCQRFHGARRR
jgi:hypothetical protein